MEKVKISSLSEDEIIYVNGSNTTITVAEVLEDTEYYKSKEIYTVNPRPASFNAKNLIEDAIEYEQENGMYEDWDELIRADVTKEDIVQMQKILDRILARNQSQNIAYESDELIEIDVK